MQTFEGRVAVVTGGASGIGLSFAKRFARERMKIVLADIEQAALDAAVLQIKDTGAAAIGVRCDVADSAQVAALADAAFSAFGAVHILCNNAGVSSQPAPSWSQSESDWKWVLGVNLWGVINGIRAFIPRMLQQNTDGHIVNTSSLSGLIAFPFGSPYHVSKFGVVALTESLHYELAVTGSKLRTSVLCPAWVRTNILQSERNRPAELTEERSANIDEDWKKAFSARLEDGLSPDTVADLVMQAIREEQLYIWTHPEYKPGIQARMEDILAGRNPDITKMLGGLGKDANKTT